MRHTPRASETIWALSFGLRDGVICVGAIHWSRLSMLRWILPATPSTSVTRISPAGFRVSSCTAATMSSACASTAAFSFASFALRCSAVEALTSH